MDMLEVKISISLLSFLFFIQAIKTFKNKKIVTSIAYSSEPDIIIEGFLARLLSILTMLGCILFGGSVTISPNNSILSSFLFVMGLCFIMLPRYATLIWESSK